MITVRFASGLAVTYNTANLVDTLNTSHDLYKQTGKKKKLIAVIPINADCIMEFEDPCKVSWTPRTEASQ